MIFFPMADREQASQHKPVATPLLILLQLFHLPVQFLINTGESFTQEAYS